jgi:hypothetical protein
MIDSFSANTSTTMSEPRSIFLLPELVLHLVELADARSILMLASTCRRLRHLIYTADGLGGSISSGHSILDMSGETTVVGHRDTWKAPGFARLYQRRYPSLNYGHEAELLGYIWNELRCAGMPCNWLLALCAREAIGARWQIQPQGCPFPPPARQSRHYRASVHSRAGSYDERRHGSGNRLHTALDLGSWCRSRFRIFDDAEGDDSDDSVTNTTIGQPWLRFGSTLIGSANSQQQMASSPSMSGKRCRRPVFVSTSHIGLRDEKGIITYDRVAKQHWHLPLPYAIESSVEWGGTAAQHTAQHFISEGRGSVRVWPLATAGSCCWRESVASEKRTNIVLRADALYTWGTEPFQANCWRILCRQPSTGKSRLGLSATSTAKLQLATPITDPALPRELSKAIELAVPKSEGIVQFQTSEVAPGLACAMITPHDKATAMMDVLLGITVDAIADPSFTTVNTPDPVTTVCFWDINKMPLTGGGTVEPKTFDIVFGRSKTGPMVCNEFTADTMIVWCSYYQLMSYSAHDIAIIACYAPAQGKERWRIQLDNRFVNNVVANLAAQRIVAVGEDELIILDMADGSVLHSIPGRYRSQIQFGLDAMLVCSLRGSTTVTAVNTLTGKVCWQSKTLDEWTQPSIVHNMDMYVSAGRILLYLPHYKVAQEIDFLGDHQVQTTTTSSSRPSSKPMPIPTAKKSTLHSPLPIPGNRKRSATWYGPR